MKQATGELNSTLVIIVSLGVVLTFVLTVLWPMIKNNLEQTTNCKNAICDLKNVDSDGLVTCHKKGDTTEFKCVYKG